MIFSTNSSGEFSNVVYIDPSIATAGDGSTPATALADIPVVTSLADDTIYLIRRTSTANTCEWPTANTNSTVKKIAFLGMPKSGARFYDAVPQAAKTAWDADTETRAQVRRNVNSSAMFTALEGLIFSNINCITYDSPFAELTCFDSVVIAGSSDSSRNGTYDIEDSYYEWFSMSDDRYSKRLKCDYSKGTWDTYDNDTARGESATITKTPHELSGACNGNYYYSSGTYGNTNYILFHRGSDGITYYAQWNGWRYKVYKTGEAIESYGWNVSATSGYYSEKEVVGTETRFYKYNDSARTYYATYTNGVSRVIRAADGVVIDDSSETGGCYYNASMQINIASAYSSLGTANTTISWNTDNNESLQRFMISDIGLSSTRRADVFHCSNCRFMGAVVALDVSASITNNAEFYEKQYQRYFKFSYTLFKSVEVLDSVISFSPANNFSYQGKWNDCFIFSRLGEMARVKICNNTFYLVSTDISNDEDGRRYHRFAINVEHPYYKYYESGSYDSYDKMSEVIICNNNITTVIRGTDYPGFCNVAWEHRCDGLFVNAITQADSPSRLATPSKLNLGRFFLLPRSAGYGYVKNLTFSFPNCRRLAWSGTGNEEYSAFLFQSNARQYQDYSGKNQTTVFKNISISMCDTEANAIGSQLADNRVQNWYNYNNFYLCYFSGVKNSSSISINHYFGRVFRLISSYLDLTTVKGIPYIDGASQLKVADLYCPRDYNSFFVNSKNSDGTETDYWGSQNYPVVDIGEIHLDLTAGSSTDVFVKNNETNMTSIYIGKCLGKVVRTSANPFSSTTGYDNSHFPCQLICPNNNTAGNFSGWGLHQRVQSWGVSRSGGGTNSLKFWQSSNKNLTSELVIGAMPRQLKVGTIASAGTYKLTFHWAVVDSTNGADTESMESNAFWIDIRTNSDSASTLGSLIQKDSSTWSVTGGQEIEDYVAYKTSLIVSATEACDVLATIHFGRYCSDGCVYFDAQVEAQQA